MNWWLLLAFYAGWKTCRVLMGYSLRLMIRDGMLIPDKEKMLSRRLKGWFL